jgi:hypothetical protein
VGFEVWGETGYEGFELGLSEAVEEEVSGYEVVGVGWGEGVGVGVVGLEACVCSGAGGLAAPLEELKHVGAGVDCVDVELGVGAEELGEEAAVSVAEDEGVFVMEESWDEVSSAALQGGAQGEVFEPAIGAGYQVEGYFVCARFYGGGG